ncbi:MAG: tRNA pseudouridine synthase A [Deltaproteobacteria bacterium]|nr:tRNA pseudouridine synthase A [Deltaproteobacteria bacterium]
MAYDGRGLAGWQRQDNGLGVQELLEVAAGRVCGHKVTVTGSGRTDAGVHAAGQTASFETCARRSPREMLRGMNSLLPESVAVLSAEIAPPGFSARFSATGKTYTYDFFTGPVRNPLHTWRSWWVGQGLDWERAAEALAELEGEHDFACFRSMGSEVKSTVRKIFRVSLGPSGLQTFRLELTGSGFLRHMARSIAGTAYRIAGGAMDREGLRALMASGDRPAAGHAAPPQGLCLQRVYYVPLEAGRIPDGEPFGERQSWK